MLARVNMFVVVVAPLLAFLTFFQFFHATVKIRTKFECWSYLSKSESVVINFFFFTFYCSSWKSQPRYYMQRIFDSITTTVSLIYVQYVNFYLNTLKFGNGSKIYLCESTTVGPKPIVSRLSVPRKSFQ